MVLPVRKTIETPQLQFVSWWSLLAQPVVVATGSRGPDSAEFVEVPQSQFLPGYGRRRVYAATSCLATVKVPQIQFIAGVSGHFSRHRDRYAQFQLCMVGPGGGDEG